MAQITLHDYLQKTEDAISSNRLGDALTHCQLMLSYFPEALEILRLLGKVYLAQGRLEEAQHTFDWVLTNDPENVDAYRNRADVSERMSEYDVALDCYQQAYELSRGHGQIREEFNRLSAKVGQKGFMFSRAGLARLYMRGDALAEALQEWEAVLTVAPDRLDARTGQLETYWRAGLLENVEQLAEQILHDVPGCLKALLLLANVISAKDSQRSQELLHRAKALDPDQTIAQALFADALASHPDDPFLRELKKAPVLLPETRGTASSENGPTPSWGHENVPDSPSVPDISLPISGAASLATARSAPLPEMQHTQSSPETQVENKEHTLEPWELLQNALHQFDTTGADLLATPASPVAQAKADLPLWESMSDSTALSQPNVAGASASYLMPGQQESSHLSGIGSDLWSGPIQEPAPPAAESASPPPVWLNMLTQTDVAARKDDSFAAPALESPSNNELPLANSPLEQLAQPNTTSSATPNLESFTSSPPSQPLSLTTEKAESQPSWFQSADVEKSEGDEESFFGPSWLRSLGATTLANEETPAETPSTAEANTQHVVQPEYTASQPQEHYNSSFAQPNEDLIQVPATEYVEKSPVHSQESVPAANPYELWSEAGLDNPPHNHERTSWASTETAQRSQQANYETGSLHEPAYASSSTPLPPSSVNLPTEQPVQWATTDEKAEQNLLTTLEELEQSLRTKGFIPLEPNSLSTLATPAQESSISSHGLDIAQAPEEYEVRELQQPASRQESQEPQETLDAPSLSSALAQLGSFAKEEPLSPAAPPSGPSFETVEAIEEPSWLQALKNSPATPAAPAMPTWPGTPIEPSTPAAYADNLPHTPPVQVEPGIAASYDLIQPAAKEVQPPMTPPAMPGNPLLDMDGELETTMKRPAIRLQPMQHRSSPSRRGESHIVSRSQSEKHIEKPARVTQPTNENLSYRDRLVKGYQHQLVGDYDEAMQEYRMIIRSGTDLLGEVVSNVRALLKLAPNYSAGYRVLGDAYMRQGEYLQAMEAYNKALTMTKRVKSRA